MATDLEKKVKEAFIDDQIELAYDLCSQAIDINPEKAELFSDRAQASIKLNNFTEAVADANKAIELDPSMAKAYLRKAIACIKLEEYETAKVALGIGASLAPGDSRFANLIKECEDHIAVETGDQQKQSLEKARSNVMSTEEVQPVMNLANQETVAALGRPKYRHEFYQKLEEVVVTIFAKHIPAQNVAVDFGEQTLSVTIDIPGEEAYYFQPRLFGKIIPAKCRYEVLSTKVEIRLAKVEPIQWTSLEFRKENAVLQMVSISSGTASQRPTHPSFKSTRVDWDKLEAQVKKEEKEEKLDGDAALNKFFQDIYAKADEDTRRAMKKSFVESSGTVLSTNWKEVGSKKVEGSPPDGMEMKKWEY